MGMMKTPCGAVQGVTGKKILTFGFGDQNDYYPAEIHSGEGISTVFTLMENGKPLGDVTVCVPGRHNILNAVAACAAALEVGASFSAVQMALRDFHGAVRRFEILGRTGGVTIADDYAHHPAEIKATLQTAKGLGYRRVWAVHQPFTYSRTALLLQDFADVLSIADRVVLSEIMGSREVNTYHIYAKDLAEKIPGCVWFPAFEEIAAYVMDNVQPGDLVITMGCGDVYKCARMMLALGQKAHPEEQADRG